MLKTWLMPGMSIFLCFSVLLFVGCDKSNDSRQSSGVVKNSADRGNHKVVQGPDTLKCQKFYDELIELTKEFDRKFRRISEYENSAFKKWGKIYEKYARDANSIIEKHDIPNDVHNAAQEFVQSVAELGKACSSAPTLLGAAYEGAIIGSSLVLMFPVGIVKGGELVGKYKRVNDAAKLAEEKAKKLNSTLINHGVIVE